jgi:adenine/guanine phosphoribosyltransferase-like PRPP-binding protein
MGATVERLGVQVRARGAGPDPRVLLGLALRNNPRRAQLLVSRVLGKHVPTDPRVVHAAGLLLGALVADALAARPPRALPVDLLHAAVRGAPGAAGALHVEAREAIASDAVDAVVLGFAETATALGHCVAEALGGADYLHSTRRPVAGVATAGSFVEEHSHHTGHLLLPSDPGLLAGPRPLVLVDDELSTGRTAVNTITALHRAAPRAHYVLATLVDLREDALAGLPDGVRVDVVALTRACLTLPPDLAERAAALRAELAGTTAAARPGGDGAATSARATTPPHAAARPADAGSSATPPHAGHPAVSSAAAPAIACATHAGVDAVAAGAGAPARVLLGDLGWPAGLPAGARHGFTAAHHRLLAVALPELAADLARAADVRAGERTLVLGTEELMAVPLRLAAALADAGHDVRFSTTTRSPAVVVDEPDYALTSGIAFPSHDDPADGPSPRFAYNVARRWDHVIVVVDPPGDTPALRTGLLPALAPHTRRTTVVVTP